MESRQLSGGAPAARKSARLANTLGSRRSPYDLENPAQYAIVDEWPNNAYGLYNRDEIASVLFPEGGGPAGSERYANRLVLYRENRMIGKANLDWQLDRYNRLKLGGLVEAEWVESDAGPPRKYYSLTDKGRAHLEDLASYWRLLNTTLENLGR